MTTPLLSFHFGLAVKKLVAFRAGKNQVSGVLDGCARCRNDKNVFALFALTFASDQLWFASQWILTFGAGNRRRYMLWVFYRRYRVGVRIWSSFECRYGSNHVTGRALA